MMSRQSVSCSCSVCGSVFRSRFSLKRHLGVKHFINEEGIKITAERYEYLRRQSDKNYIPIADRTTQAGERTANLTSQNIKVSNDVEQAGKQLDPMIKGFENFMKAMLAKEDSEKEFQSEDADDVLKTQHSHYSRGRQKDDHKRPSQKQTDDINLSPQNNKVTIDVKHPGKQLDAMLDDLMGFENYTKNMLDKPDSEMEFQSGDVDHAVKTRRSHCRRGKQKDDRKISRKQLSKYWSSY